MTASHYLLRPCREVSVLREGLAVTWPTRSTEELFWYLYTFPEGKYRHQILAELWNLEDDKTSAGRFRVTLHRLRNALQWSEAVTECKGRYTLHPELLSASSIATLYRALDRFNASEPDQIREHEQLLRNALADIDGEYLPQLQGDWLEQPREQHRTAIIEAHLILSQLHCHLGECPLAAAALLYAAQRDPLIAEDHHQRLLACLSMTRDRYAATEHYRRYRHFLQQEVGDTPLQETERLMERIKAGEKVCEPLPFSPEGKG